ncbi:PTS transporter subunit EIIC [Salmonella enterica subsp. enterica serovar Chester]|uniref:PTS transporter subunit EIIC n=1 Tax=Salmonella enterica TaxID=28901 RepID=UPI003314EB00
MDKTAALASDILRGIGGEQNILRLENCMTRVRVEVQDDSQLDIPRLKALPGVSGYVKQGEQHQLIVGPGKAAQVVDAMRVQIAAGGVKPDDAIARTKSEAKAKYKAPMSDALRKLLPGSLELILNPLLTTVITGAVAIVALQPLGGWISDAIAHGASWAIDRGGFLVGAVLAGTFLPLVLTGLHQGLVPIHVELVQAHGYNALFPILAMAGVGQIGAAIAVLMKTRNARLKKVIKGALPVGLLGIGEPLIFGVTLPLGKPFIGACLGGAVGGALISYWKVATVITFGISGLPLALTIVAGKVLFYLLGYLIAVIAGFIFTWLLGFNDPEE